MIIFESLLTKDCSDWRPLVTPLSYLACTHIFLCVCEREREEKMRLLRNVGGASGL